MLRVNSTTNLKKARMAALLCTIALLSSICAFAADFSGKWSSAGNNPAGAMFVVLRQDGNKLSGSAGPTESHQFPIANGKVDGDHIIFEAKMGGGTIRFDLASDGATLKGTARMSDEDGHSDSMNIVLKRVP